jgi:hypothetical protein
VVYETLRDFLLQQLLTDNMISSGRLAEMMPATGKK